MEMFWIVDQGTRQMPDWPFDTFEKAEIVARAYILAEPTQRVTINHDGKVLASVNSSSDGTVWVNLMADGEVFA